MNKDFEIEIFNQYQLAEGKKYSVCPLCSENRRKKTQKCMMLDWERGLGTCQHCGEVIQLHTYKATHKKNRKEKLINKPKPFSTKPSNVTFHTIPNSLFAASTDKYYCNNLFDFLKEKLGEKKTTELFKLYKIGSSKHWKGATVFWQIDRSNSVRGGKIMLYNKFNGKRVKQPYPHINWVHKILKFDNYVLRQCFFGEHLLGNNKPVAIVESEKSAIIASAYFSEFTWLAVSLNNFKIELCEVLEGKTVLLYPDLNAFSSWSDKAREISDELNVKFIVSDYLEKNASDNARKNGLDLADYLIQYPVEALQQLSQEEKLLKKFIHTNPVIERFIEKFDLVLIS